MNEAILVIDMIEDFVYGKFGSEGAQEITESLAEFLRKGEDKNIPIFFLKDSHEKSDHELEVWGEHAMKGEEGAEIIPELEGLYNHSIEKQHFDGFYDTELEKKLENQSIERLFLTGVSTEICVQHTAAGAFFRGFDIIIIKDCTHSISQEKHEGALDYMKNVYGAEIEDSKEIIEKWKERG